MYPTISYLLNDLLGINLPLPIQTFGFFMALAFLGAYYTTSLELKRKESLGLVKAFKKVITINEPVSIVDFATSIIISAFIGFKLLEMVLDYDALVLNPQKFILSAKGSWFGAILGGVYGYYTKNKEATALKGKSPQKQEITMHPYELMGNVVAIAAIAGLLGAKIFHNLENINEFIADPIGSLFSFSGLTFYGGLIVAAISVLVYTNKHNISNLHMMDAAAPGLMLAYAIGRIGCHLSGDGDWGIDNLMPKPEWLSFMPDWFWQFTYPHNVLNEGIPIAGCEGMHCYQLANPVYPTPLYEAIACLLLFAFLWAIKGKLSIPGHLFSLYLIVNGLERFLIEKIRINTTYTIFNNHITQAEIISAFLILLGMLGLVLLKKSAQK